MSWQGKKLLLVGFGRSGQAAARFLLQRGASLIINDAQEAAQELRQQFSAAQVSWNCGHHDPAKLLSPDLAAVILSPGVDPRLPLLQVARKQGLLVIGELELALREISTPVVAITGTNGKSTTTALIGHLLQAAGKKVCVAGNIGVPLLDVLTEAQSSDWLVLEVSSFQLEQSPSLHPQVAVWLNVTEDHLDRYENFAAYVDAKAQLFRQLAKNAVAIYNFDDEVVKTSVSKLHIPQKLLTFSVNPQSRANAYPTEGQLITSSYAQQKFSLQNLPLEGLHNQQNMMASLLAVQACGVKDQTTLQKALQNFQNLKHRLELVAEHRSVRYYDDSKGTNVGATIGALAGFTAPVILIAGGKDKGGSYAPLVQAAKKNVKCVILIGEAAPLLEKAFSGELTTFRAQTMQEAVDLAQQKALAGDVVLLSPACSSFDMFRNYAERGEVFRKAVAEIIAQK